MTQIDKVQNKIRHHYVPVGLSKNFCLEGKRLYLYDMEKESITPSTPKDVFLGKKLHSIITSDGGIDHNLAEDEFMNVEGSGVAAIKEILSGKGLEFEVKDALAAFISLQHLRTPVYRKGVEAMLKEQVRAVTKVLGARGDFDEVPDILKPYGESWVELIDKGVIVPEITMPQVTMQGLVALPMLHAVLMKMNWCVLESRDNNYFILSDHPCSLLDPNLYNHNMGLGFGNSNIEIAMPISKNHCILISWQDIPGHLYVSNEQVLNINSRTAIFGERFFVYPTETQEILNFLLPYKTCNFDCVCESISIDKGQAALGQNTIVGAIELYTCLKSIL